MCKYLLHRTVIGTVILAAALSFYACTSCFSSHLEGNYADPSGVFRLDLKSDSKATLTTMNDSTACTYKVDGKELTVTCENQTLNFTVQDDGSLAPPSQSMIRPLQKIKK